LHTPMAFHAPNVPDCASDLHIEGEGMNGDNKQRSSGRNACETQDGLVVIYET
jgi:hypothetical protein